MGYLHSEKGNVITIRETSLCCLFRQGVDCLGETHITEQSILYKTFIEITPEAVTAEHQNIARFQLLFLYGNVGWCH